MSQMTPPNWFPDPARRHQLRFWDGTRWTEHVMNQGHPAIDILPQWRTGGVQASMSNRHEVTSGPWNPVPPGFTPIPIQQPQQATPGLFSHRILVVNQKAKLFERRAAYRIRDAEGTQIGSVEQPRSHLVRQAVLAGPRTTRFDIKDAAGARVLTINEAPFKVRSHLSVRSPDGQEVGAITQKTMGIVRKVSFDLRHQGETVGTLQGEDWHAWNFNIVDRNNREVAVINKSWGGFAKEMFTRADNYVVEFRFLPGQPLHALALAAAIAIDTALRQSDTSHRHH